MRLSQFLEEYVRETAISKSHEYRLRLSVRQFEEDCPELDTDSLNRWLAENPRGWQLKTLHGRRADLLLLWRAAANRGLCDPPGDVRRVHVPQSVPVAWTPCQVKLLEESAQQIGGCWHNGVPRSVYLAAVIRIAYETGLRRGDIWRLHVGAVDEAGMIRMTIGKTRCAHTCQISSVSLSRFRELARILKARKKDYWQTPLYWPMQTSGLYRWFRRVCDIAGIPHGALQMLRRTGATAVEIQNPGAAPRYCGHRSQDLAYRYYVDRTKLPTIRPPSLE